MPVAVATDRAPVAHVEADIEGTPASIQKYMDEGEISDADYLRDWLGKEKIKLQEYSEMLRSMEENKVNIIVEPEGAQLVVSHKK